MVERFWEIDLLRGIAVLMMLLSNLVTDLDYFGFFQGNVFWWWLARVTATIFLILVGVSLYLSYARSGKGWGYYLRRGARIFSYGMVITLITWIFLEEGFIVFGVLHLIGVAIILGYLFLRSRWASLIAGGIFILLGMFLGGFRVGFPWLIWLGLRFPGFYFLDYFPLLPWFGVVLLGIFLGNVLYRDYRRRFSLGELTFSGGRFLSWLGRHSLVIYFLHQPVFLGMIMVLR